MWPFQRARWPSLAPRASPSKAGPHRPFGFLHDIGSLCAEEGLPPRRVNPALEAALLRTVGTVRLLRIMRTDRAQKSRLAPPKWGAKAAFSVRITPRGVNRRDP